MLQLFKRTAQQPGKDYNYADKTHFSNETGAESLAPNK